MKLETKAGIVFAPHEEKVSPFPQIKRSRITFQIVLKCPFMQSNLKTHEGIFFTHAFELIFLEME